MSLLAQQFRKAMEKTKDIRMYGEAQADVGYNTGYLNVDFTNGTIVHVNDGKNPEYDYYSTGYTDGAFTMVIGRSGCGKTTYLCQTAANIVRPFPEGVIFEDSIEGGLIHSRRQALSGYYDEEYRSRYVIRNSGVTAENFYERIKAIHDIKINDPDKYQYNTGFVDSFGNPIIKFQPTVYILDSIAMLMPEQYTEKDQLSGQMSTTASAKVIAQIFRTIIPMLKTANIMLFVVNHIMSDVQINPMMHSKSQVAGLKQGERLPKGATIIYLANNIIRLDDCKKLKQDEAFNIPGSLVEVTLVKSRSARSMQSTKLVFNQNTGFDPELSLFVMLKEAGKVNGAGIGLYFGDRSDLKFSQKNFKAKLEENDEFRKVFEEECAKVLYDIPKSYTTEIKQRKDTSGDILSLAKLISKDKDSNVQLVS